MKLPHRFLAAVLPVLFVTIPARWSAGAPGDGEQSAREVIEQLETLIENGDFQTIERLGSEWRGEGGKLPLCRDGQAKITMLRQTYQRFDPVVPGAERRYVQLLRRWKESMPDSTVRRTMNILHLATVVSRSRGPQAQRAWNESLEDLAAIEKAIGRSADWYSAFLELAIAARGPMFKSPPAPFDECLPVLEEGITRFPDHFGLYFRIATNTRSLGYDGGRKGLARLVCKLQPDRGLEPYARIYWSAETQFDGNMFAKGNCDWATFKQGFLDMVKRTPDSRWNLNHFLVFARKAGDKETARQLLARIGDKPDPETFAVEARFFDIQRWADDSYHPPKPVWRVEDARHHGIAWSPDGSRIYAYGDGGGLRILDANTGKLIGRLAWPKTEETFKVPGDPGRPPKVVTAMVAPLRPVGNITVSRDGRLVAAVSGHEIDREPGWCMIWDAESKNLLAQFQTRQGPVQCAVFSPDGRQLLAGGGLHSGPSELWHWGGGKDAKPVEWAETHPHPIATIGWATDGSKIVFNCVKGHLTVAEDKAEIRFVQQSSVPARSEIHEVSISPDGRWLAAACRGRSWEEHEKAVGSVAIFRMQDMQPRTDVLAPLVGGILSVEYSPDGRRIAAGGYDGFIYIFDAASLETKAWWNAEMGFIHKVRWSPDGRRVAIRTSNDVLTVWDVP